ncbi:hypothetical protein DPMN_034009 [Dreissena polymorpha]|uniref:Uncharacterized protein n=1 Tax=Dreissena polymorpha TaxID=45954 RepID=A0A9D4M7S2_DREPO|nr:hypothetical protein DPMN_033984 [Dreissena polymorpha]KAH3870819.1 hypothetical protein DPMN_034009 [Dreissena polymorpha]
MVTSSTTHSHDADHLAIEGMKVREEIKSSVANNRGNPGQLLSRQQSTCEEVFGAVMDACDRYELTPNPT